MVRNISPSTISWMPIITLPTLNGMGEPAEPVEKPPISAPPRPPYEPEPAEPKVRIKVKLRDGKEREIQHMASTLFYDSSGKPITAEEFMEKLFGKLPDLFKSEEELRGIWSHPNTRKAF